MSIKNLTCECCLGVLKQIADKTYKCESCDKEYIDHAATEEETIWLANANQTLRKGNFDDAYEEFANIVSKYQYSYEAYYGMCLCTHGVLFVDDNLENKKVPTCYNISISSFLEDENFKKALQYAPEELKENFLEQARKIEVIRKEWLDKASKEAPYDIFISFKQSDREKGIEKTNDYYSALELYNHLTYKCGLKVFFSPETLKNKISEKYEPYIYNALNTSKVMIVYGENPEYFSTTWVKNEWIRFLRKIKNKEKEPNSLVVCYKGFDAYSLPKELKAMQALKADSFDFLDTLLNHINKVFESDQSKQKIERKEIKVGQIATRSRTIGQNQIVKRELGSGVVVTKDADVAKVLEHIDLLISHGRFEMAKPKLYEVLDKEPNNSKAIYSKFLVENNIKGASELESILTTGQRRIDIASIDKLIANTDKNTAMNIIDIIRHALINKIKNNYVPSVGFVPSKFEDDILAMYNLLSGYEYEGSAELNKLVLDASAKDDAYLKLFNEALRTLDNNQVDEYIEYHISFVKNIEYDNKIDRLYIKSQTGAELSSIKDIMAFILNRALKVDEGNSFILEELYSLSFDSKYLESSLTYAKDTTESKRLLTRYIRRYASDLNAPYDDIVKYIPKEENKLYITALEKRYEALKAAVTINKANKERHLSQAKYYLEQLILETGETPERLYELFKYTIGCASDNDLIEYPVKLDSIKEFNDTLVLLDINMQEKLLKLLDQQERYLARKKEEDRKLEIKRREEQRIEQENRAKEEERKRIQEANIKEEQKEAAKLKSSSIKLILFGIVSFVFAIVTCSGAVEGAEGVQPSFYISLFAAIISTIISYTGFKGKPFAKLDGLGKFASVVFGICLSAQLFNCAGCANTITFIIIPMIALLVGALYHKTK